MVHSVMAVSKIGKAKQEDKKDNSSGGKSHEDATPLFSRFLEQEINEQRAMAVNCRTVTYGQDSKLHTFEYRTREYR